MSLVSSSLAPFAGAFGNLWPGRAAASPAAAAELPLPSEAAVAAPRSARDVRIDVLRGCAHLVIFIDHIPGNPVANFTPQAFGLSDASEVFVFLSGLVCGLVYTRTLLSRGWAATWGKALRRVAQVYVAYLACLFAMVAMVELSPHRLPGYGIFYRFFSDPTSFRDAVFLRTTPGLVDVLYLYMVLLVALPAGLWLFQRGGRVAMLSVSIGVYLADQSGLINPRAVFGQWFFDPIAWQLLFFVGVSLGAPRAGNRPAKAADAAPRCPGEYKLVGAATLVLLVVLVVMHVDVAGAAGPSSAAGRGLTRTHVSLSISTDRLFPMSGKSSLGPVRLAYFLVLAYVCAVRIPSRCRFFETSLGRALALTGRHSLPVFCVGRVLSCGGELVLDATARSAVSVAVTNVAGCAFLMAVARVMEARRVAMAGRRVGGASTLRRSEGVPVVAVAPSPA